METVKDTVDLALLFKSLASLLAAVAANPLTAGPAVLIVASIVGVFYFAYKKWVTAQNRKIAKIGEVVDRSTFIDHEGKKTEERNDKDNAGRDALKDMP